MRRNKTRRDENDLTGNRVEKSVITDTNHDGTFSAATDRDSVTQYTQDANDRMLSESTVVDGSATESTVYGYTGTQQTSKTVTDNTTSSVTSALNYTYDLQGRMSRAVTVAGNRTSDVSYLYGTDGIRISAREDVNQNGSTSTRITSYLIDAQNHTGYQQVLQETVTDGTGNLIQKIVYTIGHDHISQSTRRAEGVSPPSESTEIFHFDGHGNTRILTDLAGSIVTLAGLLQVYHYDAYGNALNFTMSAAATQYLYSGEQFDPRIGQQYLRARYYDSATGTFNRLDPFFGNKTDPQSFHKYLYTHADPVTGVDPSGNEFTVSAQTANSGARSTLQGIQAPALQQAAATGTQTVFKSAFSRIFVIAGTGLVVGGQIGQLLVIAMRSDIEEWLKWTAETMETSRGFEMPEMAAKIRANLKEIRKVVKPALDKAGRSVFAHVFLDMESLWAEPYAVDIHALSTNPSFQLLNYKYKDEPEKRQLRDALKAQWKPVHFPQMGPHEMPEGDFHEYPFAATAQAGILTSYGHWVLPSENQRQGRYYGWFIRNELQNTDLEPFLVVPIPATSTPY